MYVSVDIETVGGTAGLHSMISLGCVAIDPQKLEIVSEFQINIEEAEDLARDPDTMKWWESQPEAWVESTKDAVSPEVAMHVFEDWIDQYTDLTFVAHPVAFDMPFVSYYVNRFGTGRNRVHGAIDIKTMMMCVTGKSYKNCRSSKWPARFKFDNPAPHVAVEDARKQGKVFIALMRELGLPKAA